MTFENVDVDKKAIYILRDLNINLYDKKRYIIRDDNMISSKFLFNNVNNYN